MTADKTLAGTSVPHWATGAKWRIAAAVMAAALLSAAYAGPAQAAGPGTWEATGSMSTARAGHTATLLDGPACKTSFPPAYCGEVLVAGGTTNDPNAPFTSPAVRSSEIYDPRTGSWAPTGLLNTARLAHTATLLADGKVLVIGGRGDDAYGGALTSAELYDPATAAWSSCASVGTPSADCPGAMTGAFGRYDHTATLLESGKVLVVGGPDAFTSAPEEHSDPTAELYDPATGRFTRTGEIMQPRAQSSATLLPSGKVLITGGTLPSGAFPPGTPPAPGRGVEIEEAKVSSELYDPTTETWSSCSFFKAPASPKLTTAECPGDLIQSRAGHSATLLGNGQVLVAGGANNDEVRNTAELYDPSTGSWSATKMLNQRRYGHGGVLLPSGEVLAVGGQGPGFSTSLGSAELFDPADAGARWAPASFLNEVRGSDFTRPHSVPAVLLSSDASVFSANPRVCGTSCGKVLVVGGLDEQGRQSLTSAELYTPAPAPAAPSAPGPGGGTVTTVPGPMTTVPGPSTTVPGPVTVVKVPTRAKRLGVRLVLRVTPRRDRTFPYRYTAKGRLILPSGTSRGKVCATGSGSVQSKAHEKTISARRAKLRATCTFTVRVRFSVRRRLGRSRPATIRMVARFRGNRYLSPAQSKPVFVKAG